MRKLLLASVASVGLLAGMGGAHAADLATASGSPAPGHVQVFFNGRINDYFGVAGQNNTNGVKYNTVADSGYVRLYPGFDGVATNGLQYGAHLEFRINSSDQVYLRRGYVYFGTKQAGQLQFGKVDGPIGNRVGTMDGFNDGGWNGDTMALNNGVIAAFPDLDAGALYATNKVVYYSPTIAGFQFGASYDPNQSGNITGNNAQISGPNTTAHADNIVQVALNYSGTFNGVGLQAAGGYVFSGHANTTNAAGTATTNYRNYSIGYGGAEITYAGVSAGAFVVGGQYGSGFHLQQQGAKNSIGWVVGAQYQTGPVTVGAHYFHADYYDTKTAYHKDWGVAVGGTYAVAPGTDIFVDYLYGQVKPYGADNGTTYADGTKFDTQTFAVGVQMKW